MVLMHSISLQSQEFKKHIFINFYTADMTLRKRQDSSQLR